MALPLCCFLLLILHSALSQEISVAAQIKCAELIANISYSCDGLGLSNIPNTIPPSTEVLDFSFNSLFALYRTTFMQLKRISHLDLTRCNINMIYEDVFQINIHLNTLILIGNPILYIAENIFDGPLALKHLFLQQTSLSNVSFIPLENLQHLETLSFGNNFISSLQLPSNFPTKNLRVLDFQSNYIAKVLATDVEVLKQSNNLSLILKANNIEYIEPNSFSSVNLFSLDLKGNPGDLKNLLEGLHGLTTQILGVGGFDDRDPPSDVEGSTLQGLCNTTISEVNFQFRSFNPLQSAFSCLTKIQKLDLTGANLESLPALNSPIVLTELILNQNKLNNLSDISPSNFPELTSLHINSNKKTIILGDGYLKKLTKLQYLDLSHNVLDSSTCCRNQLTGLSNLRYFNVSYNTLQLLDEIAFLENDKLESLDFSNTHLTVHGPGSPFRNLKLLRYLNLSRTNLNISNESLLKGLESLIFLNMEKTSFSMDIIPNNNIFLQALQLEVLILSSCNLISIEDQAFHKLVKLQYVDLRNNKLTAFSSNAFGDLSHIHLNFAFNNISDVDSHSVDHMSGTSIVNLSHNPIKCTCFNLRFLEWYKRNENIFEDKVNTLCGYPKALEGTKLSALRLSCGLSAFWIFVIILGTLLIALGVVFGVRWCRRNVYYGI
ncbi:CD180 antigen [Xenopus laevis]|uniref:CD180 antigen n=1 Tax=Xenopus laevis TaxID=8355 RepID=A0A8J0T8S3_XENLA|nr:CD180 antigen [Xenopus laevis]